MSIKIDLMPQYVALERRFRRFMGAAFALLVGTAVVLTFLYLRGQKDLTRMQAQYAEASRVAKMTTDAQAAQTTAESAATAKQAFVQFVVGANQTGAQRAALLDLVRRYISPSAVVSQIDMSDGQNAKITATLKSPDDYARFLLNLRAGSATRGGQLFAEDPKSFAVLPQNALPGSGFTQPFVPPVRTTVPQVVTYPITMTVVGKLKDNIVVPADPGAAAVSTVGVGGPGASGGAGASGGPGRSGGLPNRTASPPASSSNN